MAERIARRQPLTKPHRGHLYQVPANEMGFAHWRVSLGYGMAQTVAGGVGWWLGGYGFRFLVCWLVLCIGIFCLVNHRVKSSPSLIFP